VKPGDVSEIYVGNGKDFVTRFGPFGLSRIFIVHELGKNTTLPCMSFRLFFLLHFTNCSSSNIHLISRIRDGRIPTQLYLIGSLEPSFGKSFLGGMAQNRKTL